MLLRPLIIFSSIALIQREGKVMKKHHRSILDTAFCSILSAAMFFSLGVTSMAEEGNAEEQPGTEVTETVEAPLPEPEPRLSKIAP